MRYQLVSTESQLRSSSDVSSDIHHRAHVKLSRSQGTRGSAHVQKYAVAKTEVTASEEFVLSLFQVPDSAASPNTDLFDEILPRF